MTEPPPFCGPPPPAVGSAATIAATRRGVACVGVGWTGLAWSPRGLAFISPLAATAETACQWLDALSAGPRPMTIESATEPAAAALVAYLAGEPLPYCGRLDLTELSPFAQRALTEGPAHSAWRDAHLRLAGPADGSASGGPRGRPGYRRQSTRPAHPLPPGRRRQRPPHGVSLGNLPETLAPGPGRRPPPRLGRVPVPTPVGEGTGQTVAAQHAAPVPLRSGGTIGGRNAGQQTPSLHMVERGPGGEARHLPHTTYVKLCMTGNSPAPALPPRRAPPERKLPARCAVGLVYLLVKRSVIC